MTANADGTAMAVGGINPDGEGNQDFAVYWNGTAWTV